MLRLKAQYGNAMRVSKVDFNSIPTVNQLIQYVVKVMHKELQLEEGDFVEAVNISYEDEDNDLIALTYDSEWKELYENSKHLIRIVNNTIPIKIIINDITIKQKKVPIVVLEQPIASLQQPLRPEIDIEAQTQELITIYSMNVEGEPHELAKEEQKIQKIEEVFQSLDELETRMDALATIRDQSARSKAKRMIDELLTQKLLKLDSFEGCLKVRRFRKYVVVRINQMLTHLERLH
jgi:hypothetical protein